MQENLQIPRKIVRIAGRSDFFFSMRAGALGMRSQQLSAPVLHGQSKISRGWQPKGKSTVSIELGLREHAPIVRFKSYSTLWSSPVATVRKTITLTDQQDEWIKAQILAGGFMNDSEVVRALIRREQDRSAEIDAIRAALIEGEQSGEARPFDLSAFKQRMRSKRG